MLALGATLLLLGAASRPPPIQPDGTIQGCLPLSVEAASRFDPPRFEDYPAALAFSGTPAAPDVATNHSAHLYRSQLRSQAKGGPDFAGRFTIAGWGCGSSCLQFALIDAKTGAVSFPSGFEYVSGVHVGSESDQSRRFWGLQYHRDSRLLVVIGTLNEDESTEGIWYLEWTGRVLKPIRWFKSAKTWCENDN